MKSRRWHTISRSALTGETPSVDDIVDSRVMEFVKGDEAHPYVFVAPMAYVGTTSEKSAAGAGEHWDIDAIESLVGALSSRVVMPPVITGDHSVDAYHPHVGRNIGAKRVGEVAWGAFYVSDSRAAKRVEDGTYDMISIDTWNQRSGNDVKAVLSVERVLLGDSNVQQPGFAGALITSASRQSGERNMDGLIDVTREFADVKAQFKAQEKTLTDRVAELEEQLSAVSTACSELEKQNNALILQTEAQEKMARDNAAFDELVAVQEDVRVQEYLRTQKPLLMASPDIATAVKTAVAGVAPLLTTPAPSSNGLPGMNSVPVSGGDTGAILKEGF